MSALGFGAMRDQRSPLFQADDCPQPAVDQSAIGIHGNQHFSLLYETVKDLLATAEPMMLMDRLFHRLCLPLDLHCYYNFMVTEIEGQSRLRLMHSGGISAETARSLESIEFGQGLCGLVAQERRQIVLNQSQIASHPNAQFVCTLEATAYAGQPLIAQGRLLGTLSFISQKRYEFTVEEVELLQAISDQVAIALDRAALMHSLQRQREQLIQTNRIKDEFLAVLSHELRSPLNPILGWAKLLRSGRLNAGKTAEALDAIERNAKLQAQLVEDLLDISRIIRGELILNPTPVSLLAVITAALETVQFAAAAKSIQLALYLDPQVHSISGDAGRLQQVIWHLLSNAVKFTSPGGTIEVHLGQGDQQVQLRVRDSGQGIAPEFLPYVFDHFRQEDSATTRQFGGLGLGLAIARQVVELHGGRIWVESPGKNQGATFGLELPLLPEPLNPTPGQYCFDPSQSI